MEQEEKKEFLCYCCKLRVKYQYFGRKPPFVKSVVLLEDSYIMRDPFSTSMGLITLGSHCSVCSKSVCASPECSIFYSKRFCLPCYRENRTEFPAEIHQV